MDFDNLTEADWEELTVLLEDPVWRICNLYKIKAAKGGKLVPFVPTSEQCEIIDAIYIDGLTRVLILKARQLGMSTVIDVILADMQIWSAGFQGSIVDQTQNDASLKLTYKVVEAFNSMPEVIRDSFIIEKDNSEEFAVYQEGDQVSVVFAGKNARGGTNQFIHISEWGPIQHEDPKRSDDIMNGAIPSAKDGIIVIETTWMGGKHGNLWQITKRAMETRKEDKTTEDYTLFFFAWFTDPQYQLEGNVKQIPKEIHDYFKECEVKLKERGQPYKFNDKQKLWYMKVAMTKGAARFAEYPTLIEECFMAPVPGAIYSKLVDAARAAGRVTNYPVLKEHPVFTFWDLGSPINTRVTYVQFVNDDIRIIDHDWQLEFTPVERVAHMIAKGYSYAGHFMPHDATSQGKDGKTFIQQMNEAGLEGIRVIPRCRSVWPGINHAAMLFPRMIFHKQNCEHLIDSLEIYRTKTSRVDGFQTEIIVEDDSCHDADTLRMLAEALMNQMLKGYGSAIPQIMKRGGTNNSRQKVATAGRYKRR